jgi:hypothetical protein
MCAIRVRTVGAKPVSTRPAKPAGHFWRPAGLAWGGANLAALAVGLFPQVLIAPDAAGARALPPALGALAVGQAGFLLLVYPLVLARRSQTARLRMGQSAVVLEAVLWLLVAAPFLATAGYFCDATVQDVVRTAIFTASAFVAGWGLAALAGMGAGAAGMAVLIGVLAVLGGPAANYLALEFWPASPSPWLWRACPVTFAWSVAGVRQASWVPSPTWAWLIWPGAGAALMLLRQAAKALSSRSAREEPDRVL